MKSHQARCKSKYNWHRERARTRVLVQMMHLAASRHLRGRLASFAFEFDCAVENHMPGLGVFIDTEESRSFKLIPRANGCSRHCLVNQGTGVDLQRFWGQIFEEAARSILGKFVLWGATVPTCKVNYRGERTMAGAR